MLQSDLLAFQPAISSAQDPEHQVRAIIQQVVAPELLPPTRSIRLYHIRGVGNDKYIGGENKDIVIYGPEFLYVLDVGYPALPGVVLGMTLSGLGDPHFPNFSEYQLRSVQGYSPGEIIFPSAVGHLLIGVQAGTDETMVKNGLSPHVRSVRHLVLDIYLAEVTPFHEAQIGNTIEQEVPFVRYAQMDHITRSIDFEPGWFADRVC